MNEKQFAEMTETEKQAFMAEVMEKVKADYKETPIETDDISLRNFAQALKTKGFNFDPFKIIKEIDSEAERQFKAMFHDMFKGLKPDRLVDIKNEIIKWYNDEEVRFEQFRLSYIETAKGPAQMDVGSTPVFVHSDAHEALPIAEDSVVIPMKKKGKK